MKSAIGSLFLRCTFLPETAAALDLPFDGWPESHRNDKALSSGPSACTAMLQSSGKQ